MCQIKKVKSITKAKYIYNDGDVFNYVVFNLIKVF